MNPKVYLIVLLSIVTSGCAVSQKQASPNASGQNLNNQTQQAEDEDFDLFEEEIADKTITIADPLEPLNRLMFGFNDVLYFWVLKPLGQAYGAVVPKPARIGIDNFFENISTPVRFVNCHLQGKTPNADKELNRFLINSTVGILGFGDPAKDRYGIEPPSREDLGQSLANFGFKDGFYLVLPLFGPSTLRDTAGLVGDYFLTPISYIEDTEARISVSAVKVTNTTSFHIGEYESLKSDSLDPYLAMRDIYIQYRKNLIQE